MRSFLRYLIVTFFVQNDVGCFYGCLAVARFTRVVIVIIIIIIINVIIIIIIVVVIITIII